MVQGQDAEGDFPAVLPEVAALPSTEFNPEVSLEAGIAYARQAARSGHPPYTVTQGRVSAGQPLDYLLGKVCEMIWEAVSSAQSELEPYLVPLRNYLGALTAKAGRTPARDFALGVVDGTFIWTASHDQRQCSLSTVSFAAAIVDGPEPRFSWSARSEARTNDLDGGENVGDQLDLPAGGCEDGAVAITEGDRTPRAAAPLFRASLPTLCISSCPSARWRGTQINAVMAPSLLCFQDALGALGRRALPSRETSEAWTVTMARCGFARGRSSSLRAWLRRWEISRRGTVSRAGAAEGRWSHGR